MSISEAALVLIVALLVIGPKQLHQLIPHLARVKRRFSALQQQWQTFWQEQDQLISLKDNEKRAKEAEAEEQSLEKKNHLAASGSNH